MKQKILITTFSFASFFSGAGVLFAQPNNPGANQVSTLGDLMLLAMNIFNILIPVLISAAVVWFIISVLQYIFRDSDEAKSKAKNNMIWGIIGIFVMVSVWGLVNVLVNTTNLDNSAPNYPCITDPNTGGCI